jgi:hypothetical protein
MAYFAQINNENIVIQVVIAETIDWVNEKISGNWIETSLDGSIRYNYASIGDTYNSTYDAFISPKVFASWVLNESTYQWEAPTPMPTDDKRYRWDEETISWVEVTAL